MYWSCSPTLLRILSCDLAEHISSNSFFVDPVGFLHRCFIANKDRFIHPVFLRSLNAFRLFFWPRYGVRKSSVPSWIEGWLPASLRFPRLCSETILAFITSYHVTCVLFTGPAVRVKESSSPPSVGSRIDVGYWLMFLPHRFRWAYGFSLWAWEDDELCRFSNVKPPWRFWDNTWPWCIVLCMCWWIQFAKIC